MTPPLDTKTIDNNKRRRKPLPHAQVRTCRLQAARVLSKLLKSAREKKHGQSIKRLTLDENKIDFPSATHAIVCETVKVLPLLKLLIEDVKMTKSVVFDDDFMEDDEQEEQEQEEKDDDDDKKDEPPGGEKSTKIKASLAYVLLYELLLSPGKSIKPPPLPPGMEDEEQKNIDENISKCRNSLYALLGPAFAFRC